MSLSKCLTILVFCLLMIWPAPAVSGQEVKKIYLVPVSGTVEPGMAAYVKRVLESLKDKKDGIIVFKLDTFGGRVDAALDIVDAISNLPNMETVAWVEKRAISAGALIALSSARLYMKKNTIIGDCAPMIQTQDGQKMAGEKIQTVLRARFRALARKNNYPVVLAEAMVTMDMQVYEVVLDGEKQFMDQGMFDDLTPGEKEQIESKRTVVAKGELLTMDDIEALELGFSQKSADSLDALYSLLGLTGAQVITMEESWSESLVRFLQPLLPVLMLLGIGALYTEIKAPGFGFPGVLGILCLGLVFFNQYLVGLADYTEMLLLLIGALLLGVEVFVLPGFGVAGITGMMVIAAGLVLAFQGFVIPDPSFPWEGRLLLSNLAHVLGSFLLALVISLFMIRFVLPKVSMVVKGPYLDATLAQTHADAAQGLGIQPGDSGKALTALRPSGKIRVKGRKIDALTQGEFISSGQDVVVEAVASNRVVVKSLDIKA